MMFNKRLKVKIDSLESRIEYINVDYREKYYALKGDFDRLVEALHLTRQETHRVEYIKKGGPEQP